MKILIVAATLQEIRSFVNLHNDIDILICGVGIPLTVYHLTNKLLQQKYDIVIQAGIGGSFSKKLKAGEVVAITQDTFADIGIEENKNFKTIFQMGFEDENKFPFKKGWLNNNSEILYASSLKKAIGVSINKITDRKKTTKQLNKLFKAEIESMEGAAFHLVCLQQNIEFLQIRSISNMVGERDKTKWKIKEAIKNLNLELIKVIDTIK